MSEGASDARVQANQRNALLSTGPLTRSGKLRVRRNALKHGLAAGPLAHKFPKSRIEAIVAAVGVSDPCLRSAAVQFAKAHLYWVRVIKVRRRALEQKMRELSREGNISRRAVEALALSDPELVKLERYEKRALRSRLKTAQALGEAPLPAKQSQGSA